MKKLSYFVCQCFALILPTCWRYEEF